MKDSKNTGCGSITHAKLEIRAALDTMDGMAWADDDDLWTIRKSLEGAMIRLQNTESGSVAESSSRDDDATYEPHPCPTIGVVRLHLQTAMQIDPNMKPDAMKHVRMARAAADALAALECRSVAVRRDDLAAVIDLIERDHQDNCDVEHPPPQEWRDRMARLRAARGAESGSFAELSAHARELLKRESNEQVWRHDMRLRDRLDPEQRRQVQRDGDLWAEIHAAASGSATECRSVALEAAVLLRDAASAVGQENSRLGVACEAMARRLESGSSADERHNAAVASVMFRDDNWGTEGDR